MMSKELKTRIWGYQRRSVAVLGFTVAGAFGAPLAIAVPGTVTGVTATVISSQQINVSWTAVATATKYNIYRCSGSSSCTPSTTVFATSTTTNYSNTGLISNSVYRYRLKAVDASNAVSASYSSIVSGTTPAVGAPSALTATAASSSQINLGWTASAGAISGYQVERCTGTTCTPAPPAVGTPTTNSYSNTGLLSSTTYRYRVRAVDAANNASAYTSVVARSTPAVAAPSALIATAVSSSQINLSWTASTGTISGYQVERCTGTTCMPAPPAIGSPTTNNYNNTGVTASTTYRYRVRAADAGNNVSAYTSIVSGTTPAGSSTTTSTYSYDATAHLKTITTTSGVVVQYTYDAAGNVTGVVKTP
jgi:YD repeat-containing protein